MNFYEISVQKSNGQEVSMDEYKGKVIVIVNTATGCGLAPQLEDLETLWNLYPHDDVAILGFPCGQFANQEKETNEEIQQVCKLNFGVTFPIYGKLEVNGKNTHPLYKFLKSKKGGWLSSAIKWNFTKFLIDQKGNVVKRYAPTISPISMKPDIENLINKK